MKVRTKETVEMYGAIAKRADQMGLLFSDRLSLIMDLEVADNEFNLRLEELLKTDEFNFGHDVVGIQQNMDRTNRKVVNHFVPRYATA